MSLNAYKIEFGPFCKNRRMCRFQREIIFKGENIISSISIKNLGFTLDRNLSYQEEVKIIPLKKPVGIKAMHSMRSIYGEQTMLHLLKVIILFHLLYPSLLLTTNTSNLTDTLDLQVNWALKTCFEGKKYDSSNDLGERYQILPVRAMLDIQASCYFWKLQIEKLPAFNRGFEIPITKVKVITRTKQLTLQLFMRFNSDEKLFFRTS